ncbi:MAG TPA: multiheme c-type cytochrome [Polyangiaceae bacterium]|nr:multiheme c-type cytochrome [Polyangiaceae bacterium]
MLRASAALLVSFCCLAGCAREDIPSDLPSDLQSASTPAPAAAGPRAPEVAPSAPEPSAPMPGPHRKRLGAAVALNATCISCHEEEARQWLGSYHQRANTDAAYRKAFALEPSPFCRGCHAPEADSRKEPPEEVSKLGVGCVTCHVTEEGLVLAGAIPAGDAERIPAPHPLRRSPEFAGAGGCAGCHEFRFPMPGGDEDAFFMQTTAREHRRSPSATKACADCHMPLQEGRRSHAFAQVRDPAWLRANLEVTAERTEDDTLRFTLVQPNPGHDYPTGDLFRRLEVGYELRTAGGALVRREARHLARHFELVPDRVGRHLSRDDRVTSEPRILEMDLPPTAAAPPTSRISWWVTYQRVATVGMGTNPAEASVESEVKLHSGDIAWNSR